jgi:hypothetical protein
VPSEYDPANRTAGTVIFVMNGTTDGDVTRNYTIYFDIEANGLKPVADYGDPDYVLEYRDLLEKNKVLGSSPLNGSTDSWWFPPYLDLGKYDRQAWIIGEIKATMHAWGDGTKDGGVTWIRHYADVSIYRNTFNAFVKTWNNGSDFETAWASGLANISTGSPAGTNFGSADEGLTVITDDWSVHNFTTLGFKNTHGYKTILAGDPTSALEYASGNDTYDRGMPGTFETDITVYPSSTTEYKVTGGEHDVLEIRSIRYANGTIVPAVKYHLVKDVDPRSIVFDDMSKLSDGDVLTVNYTRKLYDGNDYLAVIAKKTSTRYLIMYDEDDRDEISYAKPQIGAIIMPKPTSIDDMVFEFWLNTTGDQYSYYLNISTNYNEWWFNATDPGNLHDLVENKFEFIASYMNGSADPRQETIVQLDSYNNPAVITNLGHEDAIPIGLSVTAPYEGQMFNAWTALPGDPYADTVTIEATATGDTLSRFYYTINDGSKIDFTGHADIPVTSIDGDPLDGHVFIKVVVTDTNGGSITKYLLIYVPKTFWQHILGSVGSVFVVLMVMIGGFMGICGIASIRKKRAASTSVPTI